MAANYLLIDGAWHIQCNRCLMTKVLDEFQLRGQKRKGKRQVYYLGICRKCDTAEHLRRALEQRERERVDHADR